MKKMFLKRKLLFLVIFSLLCISTPMAQPSQWSLQWSFDSAGMTAEFGEPSLFFRESETDQASSPMGTGVQDAIDYSAFMASAGARYLRSEMSVSAPTPSIRAGKEGEVLFLQSQAGFANSFPTPAGNLVALAHDDKFVSIYSGHDFVPDSALKDKIGKGERVGTVDGKPGSAAGSYAVQIYDGESGVWVNPAFFVQVAGDKKPPLIEQVALLGKDGEFLPPVKKKEIASTLQGTYTLAARIVDLPSRPGAISGVFRLKVVLDGQVLFDKKMDAARATAQGLSFLDLGAPSSSVIDGRGRFLLGDYFFARGVHNLEFLAYDFAGNVSNFLWKFKAE